MAGPSSASDARILLERELKEAMVNVCEAEQRSKLIGTLLRLGLVTREVGSFLGKQKENQRSSKQKNQMKSGVQRMREKLSDSRGEEDLLRRVRDKLRVSLEEVLNIKNQYGRIIKKLKAKVQRIKTIEEQEQGD